MISLISYAIVAAQPRSVELGPLIGHATDQRSYFKRIFPHPTGKNGLEFYAQAVDLARSDRRLNRLAARAPSQLSGPSLAAEVAAVKPIIALLQKGLALPFDGTVLRALASGTSDFIPNATAAPDFFEFGAGLKHIAKVVARASQYGFDCGQLVEPTRNILLTIRVSRQFIPLSLIPALTAIASEAVLTATFNQSLFKLSSKDIALILEATKSPISPSAMRACFQADDESTAKMLEKLVREATTHKKRPPDMSEAEWTALQAELGKLSPEKRRSYPSDSNALFLKQRMKNHVDLDQPEHLWNLDGGVPDPELTHNPIVDTMLAVDMGSVAQQARQAFAKSRTEFRLLRLHAFVQRFRIQHHHLPGALVELKLPAVETFDPLTNGAYIYIPAGQTYHLASRGFKASGEIELRYRRGLK